MAQLELIETDLDQGCRRISVAGELDLAVAAQLEEAIGRATDSVDLLIDLSDCDFIDSTAVALFVRTDRDRRADGRSFALVAPHDQVERVLGLTGLDDDGLVFGDLDSARLASCARWPMSDTDRPSPRGRRTSR